MSYGGASMYGPGMSYNLFAGRDASVALAKVRTPTPTPLPPLPPPLTWQGRTNAHAAVAIAVAIAVDVDVGMYEGCLGFGPSSTKLLNTPGVMP